MSYETYDYDEDQRRRAQGKQARLQNEARGMSTPELLRSLSWQEGLADHYAEIGEASHNGTAGGKADIIREELRRRGRL